MGGVTFGGTGSVIASSANPSLPQSIRYNREAQNTKIKSVGGDVVTSVYHGFKKTVSITVVPSATTIANAVASKEAHLVAPGSKLTMADASGATQLEQNWIVLSSQENRTIDGAVTVDLELMNAETDLSATVAAS